MIKALRPSEQSFLGSVGDEAISWREQTTWPHALLHEERGAAELEEIIRRAVQVVQVLR